QARVLDPHLQRLGDHDLDPVGQLARTRGVHHYSSSPTDVSSSVPLTSCLLAESSSSSGWPATSRSLTSYFRRSSATRGRTSERFCFRDRTSPSSRSNATLPVNTGPPDQARAFSR